VTLSDRDRKIVFAIVPILLIVGYWFLLLGPKRDEATKAEADAAKQEQRRDTAQSAASQASSAKNAFASDYTEVIRLGKAIPSAVDMPGLIVQLDRAADGTGIRFTKIATGDRQDAASSNPTPPASPSTGGSASSTGTPAAAGGETAQSGPGTAAESANNAAAKSDQTNGNIDKSSGGGGGTGAGGTTTAPVGSAAVTPPEGLETVPLTLEFEGNFFNLADFFHRVKRLVRVVNNNVVVSGRLVTIESVKYSSDPELFPKLKAELEATVYLAPASQGTSAGASPQGPSATTPAGDSSAPSTTPAPAATATP
jgi:Tfp pilus assembly protein PilO